MQLPMPTGCARARRWRSAARTWARSRCHRPATARVIVDMDIDRSPRPGRPRRHRLRRVGQPARPEAGRADQGQRRRPPRRPGTCCRPRRSAVTTDLDQVLDVLDAGRPGPSRDPDQRGRSGVHRPPGRLQRDAPAAPTGPQRRRGAAERHLADNHTLADLVQGSDGFVIQLAQQRSQLVHVVKVLGRRPRTTVAEPPRGASPRR